MIRLEKLTQTRYGSLIRSDGTIVESEDAILRGRITTFVVRNPCVDIADFINEMVERDSSLIPDSTNSFVASLFNCDTQHRRKDGKGSEGTYSVYAVQFYYVIKRNS